MTSQLEPVPPAGPPAETERRLPAALEPQSSSLTPSRKNAWIAASFAPLLLWPVWTSSVINSQLPEAIRLPSGMVLILVLSVCTLTDLLWRKIPNWMTYTSFLWALGLSALESGRDYFSRRVIEGEEVMLTYAHVAELPLSSAVLGFITCFVFMICVYRLAGGGAGDVKLAGVIGALIGAEAGFQSIVYGYIAGGIGVLLWMGWSVGPVKLLSAFFRKVGSVLLPIWIQPPDVEDMTMLRRPVPLAPFFAIGTFLTLFEKQAPW